jgi:hypothetical protein
MTAFSVLKGFTLTAIQGGIGDEKLVFITNTGRRFQMYHDQDCCEQVYIESITGDLADLIGHPILLAEESTSGENPPDYTSDGYQDSFTWTFYKLATIKGYVDIRWYGESNGYYSEGVDFEETNPHD